MARVAFFNVPAHGHVNPTLGVVKGLVDRGEEVLYHTHPEFLEKVEATGATFCQGDPPLDYDHTRPDMNLLVLASVLMESSSVLLDRYLELYPPGRIDYVIHDSMCP